MIAFFGAHQRVEVFRLNNNLNCHHAGLAEVFQHARWCQSSLSKLFKPFPQLRASEMSVRERRSGLPLDQALGGPPCKAPSVRLIQCFTFILAGYDDLNLNFCAANSF